MANTKVQSEQIEDGSITADKIADGAIVATELADNAVTTAKINADAVTGAKIADDAINSEHYTDGSIDTAHIADDQVTQAKMANDSVGADELASSAVVTASIVDANVTTAKIADGNISTAKIADNAVTSAKIDTNIDIAGTFDVTGATVLDSTLAVAGDANFDSGTLFVDVSADNVGIGTTSPSDYNSYANNLVIYEAGHGGITIATGTSNHASIYFADGTSGDAEYRGYLDYDHADDSLDIGTAGAVKASIDSSGNFKIGAEPAAPTGGAKGKLHIDGGSTGSRFDALAVKHIETNTTGDGPAIRFEGEYNGSAWALAEMSATNGGAGYGANFAIDMHPGSGTQGSNVTTAFSLDRTHEGIIRQRLNAQTFTLAANAQETFSGYINTTGLVNIASQRNGSNGIIYTGALFYLVYSSSVITEIADVNDLFLTADTSSGAGKICIYKGNATATFYIVNRTSHTMTLSVHIIEMQGN